MCGELDGACQPTLVLPEGLNFDDMIWATGDSRGLEAVDVVVRGLELADRQTAAWARMSAYEEVLDNR